MSESGSDEFWPAPAKLNLFLQITDRRADGYHELQTVYQFLEVADRLWFDIRDDGVIGLEGGLPDVPPEQDLIVRAARSLVSHTGCRKGVRVRVDKRLSAGAGLGGGSSDAATTLVALNALWDLALDVDELAGLGLQLGADVPVFVRGFAAWAEGIGEQLTPMMDLPEPWYLVLNPAVKVSTAGIFSDPRLTRNAPPLKIPAFVSGAGINHLQEVVVRRYPEVGNALKWLEKHLPARMTGSGSCVFAACRDRQQAESILQQVPTPWTGFVARGCNRSPLQERLGKR
ncbi:MAG: 4-(cytidine 5'-diphospho)-2-C-methyl-D-erythritol kinase [Gammaproteobacteria bacterium]|nr:MAG: 4-(cytidine 5'-diphospho)-2-C-methyl-D-erythritol kinase [Gammaproteobacteria bacterium]